MEDGNSDSTTHPSNGSRLGGSLKLKGTITSEEDIYVAGRFEGGIDLPKNKLVVAKDAVVHADVRAGKVLIQGTVHGNVQGVQRVELTSTADLIGELQTREIRVEEGAVFRGQVNIITDRD